MPVQYRESRKTWGFRAYREGKCIASRFSWDTKEEADMAFHRYMVDEYQGPIQFEADNKLRNVTIDYFRANQGKRSNWRMDGLKRTFESAIWPYFGETTPITSITADQIEKFIEYQQARTDKKLKNSTIWHFVTDIRAMMNWAIKQTRRHGHYGITDNPVNDADLSAIKNRKVRKLPLNPEDFETAAAVLTGADRAYFNMLRYVGHRKDEGNGLKWTDLDLDRGLVRVPGTKTDGSLEVLPLARVVIKELLELRTEADPDCPWVFPGNSAQTKGKRIYRRTAMFKRIKRLTGIHLCPKDCRDYFASEVSNLTNDPNTIMRLLRHTNLQTTTGYLRTVQDRMAKAVEGLGEK